MISVDEKWVASPVLAEMGYAISNCGRFGRIKRLASGKYQFKLLGVDSSSGYFRCRTTDQSGNQVKHLIHRLVATAFIPNTGNLPEVNHIDEDKSNNSSNNLEWCTSSHNKLHSSRLWSGNRNGKAVLNESDVREIKSLLAEGTSCYIIRKLTGIHPSTLSNIKFGRSWNWIT